MSKRSAIDVPCTSSQIFANFYLTSRDTPPLRVPGKLSSGTAGNEVCLAAFAVCQFAGLSFVAPQASTCHWSMSERATFRLDRTSKAAATDE